jgi:O-antigen ligase
LLLESLVMIAQFFTDFELSALGIQTVMNGSDIESAAGRPAGTFSGANSAGTFLATTLVIAFGAWLANNRLINNRLAFIALLAGTAALATTQSRSALTAFGAALPIVMLQAVRRRLGLRAFLMFLVLVAVLLGGFSRQLIERFTDSGEQSAEARILHAELALNILKDYMLTGVGLNNVRFVATQGDYMPLEMIGRDFTRIHNKYLAIWVETGLFGLLAFVWLLLAAARRAISGLLHASNPYISIAITGLLAALFAYSWHMSSATFTERSRLQFFWLLLALIAISAELVRRQDKSSGLVLEAQPAATESTSPQTADWSQA